MSVLLLAASQQTAAARCRFFTDQFFGYTCELNDVEVLEENFNLVIETDNHAAGRNDSQVTSFTIANATMRFFPNSIMRQFPSIRYLLLENSGMTALTPGSFDGCASLVILFIRRSAIERIPAGLFNDCSQLGVIDFSWNEISEIDDEAFDGLSSLLELDINYNQLTRISSRVFRDLVNVEELNLRSNVIAEIEDGAFSTLRGLISFYLLDNQITEIRPEMFGDEISLVGFNLNQNSLTSVPRLPSRAPRINYIYLVGNLISEVNEGDFTFAYSNITSIDLSENMITTLSAAPFEVLTSLDQLAVNYNRITAVDNEFFERIASLYTFYFEGNLCANVAFNNIRSIDQEDVIAATFDRCYYNFFESELAEPCTFVEDGEHGYTCELSDITFLNFRDKFAVTGTHIGTRTNADVRAIRITNSNFARVPPTIFRTFPNLISFSLINSGLEVVNSGTFEQCGEITHLDLTGNRIRHLAIDSFENCLTVGRLILDDNRITEIQPCNSFLLNVPLTTFLSMRRNICIDRVFESGSWLIDNYQYNVYRHINRCFSLFYMFLDRVNSDTL